MIPLLSSLRKKEPIRSRLILTRMNSLLKLTILLEENGNWGGKSANGTKLVLVKHWMPENHWKHLLLGIGPGSIVSYV